MKHFNIVAIAGLSGFLILSNANAKISSNKPNSLLTNNTLSAENLRQIVQAVTVQTLAKITPNLAVIPSEWQNKQQADKPPVGNTLADKINNVNHIAQKITVKIDSKNNGNGSGVIIARQGQTYYVATAHHVIEDSDSYEIITPDGERYAVQPEIIKSQGTHAVLIKFTSNKRYSVATLSKYNQSVLDYINQKPKQFWVFLSGFPAESGKRKLNPGYLRERENLFTTSESLDSLSNLLKNGYMLNLSYSNLSLLPLAEFCPQRVKRLSSSTSRLQSSN